ncbi:MAG: hypothetical protein J5802_12345 [Butyrivibrio sp.]|nr:hypothetical protein [Butyrivibrio sp.]
MKKRVICALALALALTGCNGLGGNVETEETVEIENEEDDTDTTVTPSTDDKATEEVSTAADAESSKAEVSDSSAATKPSGTYSRTYTEEIGGDNITSNYSYTFNDDGTGSAEIQDTVPMTWDDSKITINGESYEYKYNADTNTVSVKEEFGWEDYVKE